MSDLEVVRICAEALTDDIEAIGWRKDGTLCVWGKPYDPLHDDAQAMALVKRFQLWIGGWLPTGMVTVSDQGERMATAADLNRAIVECVAKMHGSGTASR